jgi:nitrogen-specific signal transduction histidine kinase
MTPIEYGDGSMDSAVLIKRERERAWHAATQAEREKTLNEAMERVLRDLAAECEDPLLGIGPGQAKQIWHAAKSSFRALLAAAIREQNDK